MLFYRKKFLLAVLEGFGGSVDNLRFQKYLFLILNQRDKKHYSFVPYQYGCFSFESYNDKRSLTDSGFLKEDEKKWILSENSGFLSEINEKDRAAVFFIQKKYGNLSQNMLLNQVYSKYPYYAINSRIIQRAGLNFKEKKAIENSRPRQKEPCLFTIGYEGRSIDEYLDLLIKHNIKILYDVRKNPLSRKYGFSKRSLKSASGNLRIDYYHIPELGVESHLRKNLLSERDYKRLFDWYKTEVIFRQTKDLNKIMEIAQNKTRAALTCFEADPLSCHRSCIASFLKMQRPSLNLRHL